MSDVREITIPLKKYDKLVSENAELKIQKDIYNDLWAKYEELRKEKEATVQKDIYNDLWAKYEELRKEKEATVSDLENKISCLEIELDRYVGVTSSVFGREVLEEFLTKKVMPYLHGPKTADKIEATCVQFLNDASNSDATAFRNFLLKQLCISSMKTAAMCRLYYKKLSSVIHVASLSFQTLHAAQNFMALILEIPKLSPDEKKIIETMTAVLHP